MIASVLIVLLSLDHPQASLPDRLKSLRRDQEPRAILEVLGEASEENKSASLAQELYEILIMSAPRAVQDPLYRMIYSRASMKAIQLFPKDHRFVSLMLKDVQKYLKAKDPKTCLEKLRLFYGLDSEEEAYRNQLRIQCELLVFELKAPGKLEPDEEEVLGQALSEAWFRKLPPRLERQMYRLLLSHVQGLQSSAKMSQEIVRYPYDRRSKEYADLLHARSRVMFKELELSPRSSEFDYYQLYRDSPKTEVGRRALERSIELSRDETLTQRCREYMEMAVGGDRHLRGGSLHRCYIHFTQLFQLEDMQRALVTAENGLSEDYRIRLGLIELALGFPTGEGRLKGMANPKALKALSDWKGPTRATRTILREWKVLAEKVSEFNKSLIAVLERGASRYVPKKIKIWESIDAQLAAFIQQKRMGYEVAEALMARAFVASQFRDWIRKIPPPQLLTPDQMEAYKAEMNQVNEYWDQIVRDRGEECAQRAYTEDEFWVASDAKLCPDKSAENLRKQKQKEFFAKRSVFEEEWAERARPLREVEALEFLKKLKKMSEANVVRFWILEIYPVFHNPIDQASALVELYRRTLNLAYIEKALELYPFSREALEIKWKLMDVNSFFKVYWARVFDDWPKK